jgi:hypothetical protein
VVRGELDAVVVGGGDGSIRTVASILVGSDVPLGIIPLGTLNHFAKDLRVPLIAERAVAVIACGETARFSSTIHRLESIRSWFLNESGRFGTCPCSGLGFVFKVPLKSAEARACSSETTGIASLYRPSAGVIDLIGANCAATCKVR